MGPVVQSVLLPRQSPLILGLGELKTGLQRRVSIMKGGGQTWDTERNNTPHRKSWGGEGPHKIGLGFTHLPVSLHSSAWGQPSSSFS